MNSPTPKQIIDLREEANLTQTAAAASIYKALRTWQQWEKGDRKMDPALWELFTLKLKQQKRS